jgi:hypothetical protein
VSGFVAPSVAPAANTEPVTSQPAAGTESAAGEPAADTGADTSSDSAAASELKVFEVYGDSAYANGATLDEQTARGHDMRTKVPPVRNANGYSKDRFTIDLAAGTVTCPAEHTVAIQAGLRYRVARFGVLCGSCPLRAQCTTSQRVRSRSRRIGSGGTHLAQPRRIADLLTELPRRFWGGCVSGGVWLARFAARDRWRFATGFGGAGGAGARWSGGDRRSVSAVSAG